MICLFDIESLDVYLVSSEEQKITQRYAKTVALLSSETGGKTSSAIFKNSPL